MQACYRCRGHCHPTYNEQFALRWPLFCESKVHVASKPWQRRRVAWTIRHDARRTIQLGKVYCPSLVTIHCRTRCTPSANPPPTLTESSFGGDNCVVAKVRASSDQNVEPTARSLGPPGPPLLDCQMGRSLGWHAAKRLERARSLSPSRAGD